MLSASGIDTSVFKAHSTRAAATSAANSNAAPIKDIISAAGWKNETTFSKFYNKDIVNFGTFSDSVLKRHVR